MKHTGIKITFQLEDAQMWEHTTDSATGEDTTISGVDALNQLRDMLMNCAVSADVFDGTVTLTISK